MRVAAVMERSLQVMQQRRQEGRQVVERRQTRWKEGRPHRRRAGQAMWGGGAPLRMQWCTNPPRAATSPLDDVAQVAVTSTSGSHGICFNDSQLGHLTRVSTGIMAHSVLPGDFCLAAVNATRCGTLR